MKNAWKTNRNKILNKLKNKKIYKARKQTLIKYKIDFDSEQDFLFNNTSSSSKTSSCSNSDDNMSYDVWNIQAIEESFKKPFVKIYNEEMFQQNEDYFNYDWLMNMEATFLNNNWLENMENKFIYENLKSYNNVK